MIAIPHPKRNVIFLFLIAILVVSLRSWAFFTHPGGMLDDEALVLHYTKSASASGHFQIIKTAYPHGEAMHGWLQTNLPIFTHDHAVTYRIYALVTGILTVFLFGLVTTRLTHSPILGHLVAFFLGVGPWHLFYSQAFSSVLVVTLLFVLSSYLFLVFLRKGGTCNTLGLITITFLGLFYYTSFRILLIYQLILLATVWYRGTVRSREVLTFIVTLSVAIPGVLAITKTPWILWMLKGIATINQVETRPFLNVIYAFFSPLFRPSYAYSHFSKFFMGDPLSYAFWFANGRFIQGLVATLLTAIGLTTSIFWLHRNWKDNLLLAPQSLPATYAFGLSLVFVIVVGFAGPSYSRLLPLSLTVALLAGLGLFHLGDYAMRRTQHKKKIALWILGGILFLGSAAEASLLIRSWSRNTMISLVFNSTTHSLLRHLQMPAYQHLHKLVFCRHNYDLCRYHALTLSKFNWFYQYAQLPPLLDQIKGPVSIFWPTIAKAAPDYFERQFQTAIDFDLRRLNQWVHVTRVTELRIAGRQIGYEIRINGPRKPKK